MINDNISNKSIEYNLCQCGCNKPCKNKYVSGHNSPKGPSSPLWKQGIKLDKGGYIMIRKSGGYIREHRLIMEQHLGRSLKDNEIVHHINGNKQDNRLENLELTTRSLHHINNHIKDMSGITCFECGNTKTRLYSFGKHGIKRPIWYKHPKDKSKWCCTKCIEHYRPPRKN